MKLGLAGAISGIGEGASKGLALAQAQYGAERLQSLRDAGDELRQARLMEHQSSEAEKTRATTVSESEKTRVAAKENTTATLLSHEKVAGEQIAGQKDIAGEHNKTNIKIHDATNLTNEKIHAETNRINLLIAQGHDSVQRETNDASLKTSLASVINASEREITRLQTELLDPLKNNPKDPQVTLLRESIETAKREVSAFKTRYQQLTGTKPAEAPVKAGFQLDPSLEMKKPGGPVSRGLAGQIVTPLPSVDEQDEMRKALAP